MWHLRLQLCIAAALLFGGGRGRGKRRSGIGPLRQAHICAQFSFTDPSVCNPRSCDYPVPGASTAG